MAERRIEDLEGPLPEASDGAGDVRAAVRPTPAPPAPAAADTPSVDFNYPEPTAVSLILRDVARWSKMSLVMEPSVNARIQVFAARRLTPREAWDLFLASLSVVGLRAVQQGAVVKIVPVTVVVAA